VERSDELCPPGLVQTLDAATLSPNAGGTSFRLTKHSELLHGRLEILEDLEGQI